MKLENLTTAKIIILCLILFPSKATTQTNSKSYTSKTYLYRGNSFAEKYNSIIDTLNYTWRDSFSNGKHLFREYPKYGGNIRRKETFSYYNDGTPKKTIIHLKNHIREEVRERKDSIVYKKIDVSTIVISKYLDRETSKQIQKTSNDTLYTEQYINDKYAFTAREFWETKTRKHDQIIKPYLSEVSNVFVYDQYGNQIKTERYENGKFTESTIPIKYEYDSLNRVITKETFYGEGKDIVLGSTEITIYSDD